jgi:hypothetical protein
MEVAVVQFLVMIRGNEASILPPAQEVALVRETFEQLASGKDKRIKAVYPFVGERAGALLCEASTPEELQECLMALPFWRLVRAECHVVGTPKALADQLGHMEQRLASMPAAAGRN